MVCGCLYQNRLFQLQAKELTDNVTHILQREFEGSKEYVPNAKDWLSSYWSGFMSPNQKARIRNTGAIDVQGSEVCGSAHLAQCLSSWQAALRLLHFESIGKPREGLTLSLKGARCLPTICPPDTIPALLADPAKSVSRICR